MMSNSELNDSQQFQPPQNYVSSRGPEGDIESVKQKAKTYFARKTLKLQDKEKLIKLSELLDNHTAVDFL